MTDAVRAMLLSQADGCEGLGSPLTARVLRLLAASMQPGTPVEDRVLGWQGDLSRTGDAMALRLAGGLHALVLMEADAELAAFYRDQEALDDAAAVAVLRRCLRDHSGVLNRWLDSAPQTNEVRRSAALMAAGHWLTARLGLPIVLSELGASVGLNLLWDHYALNLGAGYGPAGAKVVLRPDWQGDPPPVAAPKVITRAGVDLQPLHPVQDRLRALSYIWADQTERLARTAAALDIAATNLPPIVQGDAIDWLQGRLEQGHPGALQLVYHTIAWQYFPPAAQAQGLALFDQAGARATATAPLAHLSMEADAVQDGAALVLWLWTGGAVERFDLARVDFHGRWLRWTAA